MTDQESKILLLLGLKKHLEMMVDNDGRQSVWFLPIKMLFKLLVVPHLGEDKSRERC
jgi:hypothetical protein